MLPNVVSEENVTNGKIITSGQYGNGYRYNIQGWVYLHLEGDPYERGYQYGYLASDEIIQTMERWANVGHSFNFMKLFLIKNKPENYYELSEQWWDICRTKSKNVFLKSVPEEFQEEMQGMTDALKDKNGEIFGRKIDFNDILAAQFVQDVWYAFASRRVFKRIHPVRSIIQGLQDLLSGSFIREHNGHCNAFIANGEYTEDGEIIAVHATVFSPYIAQRCNFIVDIQPSDGNRFMMTSPPGSLWSQEDWYQNDKGIILTETELNPQGPFNIRKTPKGVRSRTAIQYSDNIDDVLYYLDKDNNGLIPNEWLIGDINTGEIASYQQLLYNKPLKRTDSGYFWSCTKPHELSVLSEQLYVPKFLIRIVSKLFPDLCGFRVEGDKLVYIKGAASKLIELGDEYKGRINLENAKDMISTSPLTDGTTDCKITDSKSIENFGFIAHMGVTNGSQWSPSEKKKNNFKTITILPANGWVEIYPIITKPNDVKTNDKKIELMNNSEIIWTYNYEKTNPNYNYSKNIISEGVVYSITQKGQIYAKSLDTGWNLWTKNIGNNPTEPVLNNGYLIVNSDDGFYKINKSSGVIEQKDTGYSGIGDSEILYSILDKSCLCINQQTNEKIWEFETEGIITAKPIKYKDTILFGSRDGYVYKLDSETGELIWKTLTNWGIDTTPAISEEFVYVGSLDNNLYCIDFEKGDIIWKFVCASAIHSNPLIYGDFVFFGCDDGVFYAVNKTTGLLEWDFAPGYVLTENSINNYITTPILSDPVAEDGIVIISTKGTIYALDAQTIEVEKEIKSEEEIDIEPLIMIISLILIVIIFVMLIVISKRKRGEK
jgi:outer membrane protein assembly factor BamB